MTGSYILILKLPERQEKMIGKLGRITFAAGFYAYVGSALNGLEARLYRHLREDKKRHWHIDYLLHSETSITEIIVSPGVEKTECLLSQALASRLTHVPGFGCSDCRCDSHLYFCPDRITLLSETKEALHQAGLPFQFWSEPRLSKPSRIDAPQRIVKSDVPDTVRGELVEP